MFIRSWRKALAALVFVLLALGAQSVAGSQGPTPLPEALQPVTRPLAAVANPAAALAKWKASLAPGVTASTVFPPDDRVRVADTTAAGWRTVTLVVSFDAASNPLAACSGMMIGDNVVLTAAHCVFNGGQYVASVVVAPGATPTSNPFGVVAATRYSVPTGWANTVGQSALGSLVPTSPYDWALIFLDGHPFHGRIGPYLTVANAPDSYFQRPGLEIATAGYPGDKPFASMWSATTTDFTVDATYLTTTLDVAPGQSGSAIYTLDPATGSGFVFSVVSVGDSTANYSVRFTQPVIAALNSYCAANGCSFTSTSISESYTFNGYAFCRTSPTCASGSEGLIQGQPVRVGFHLTPNPDQQVRAVGYFNGTQFNSWVWAAPTPPGGGTFYVGDPGLGTPSGPGTLELRIWVGGVYVGAISAQVAAAPPTVTPTATTTPVTATATPTPVAAPSPAASPAGSSRRPFRAVVPEIGVQ